MITQAKVLGNEIAEKQKIAEVTEGEIERARVAYKPCGDYTAILFFCISDLANIDPMYQVISWQDLHFYTLSSHTVTLLVFVHISTSVVDNIHDTYIKGP